MGFEGSFLGFPTSDETGTVCKGGRYNNFANGAVVYQGSAGAHESHGAIRNEWAAKNYECSTLSFPTTDTVASCNSGYYQSYQGGAIYYNGTVSATAHWTWGNIFAAYAGLGYQCNSYLGYPTNDIWNSSQDFLTQNFSGGSLTTQQYATPLSWNGASVHNQQYTAVFCDVPAGTGCSSYTSLYNASVSVDHGVTSDPYNIPAWYRDYHDQFELDTQSTTSFVGMTYDYHSRSGHNFYGNTAQSYGCMTQYRYNVQCDYTDPQTMYMGKSQSDVTTAHTLFSPTDGSVETAGDEYWVAYAWSGQ